MSTSCCRHCRSPFPHLDVMWALGSELKALCQSHSQFLTTEHLSCPIAMLDSQLFTANIAFYFEYSIFCLIFSLHKHCTLYEVEVSECQNKLRSFFVSLPFSKLLSFLVTAFHWGKEIEEKLCSKKACTNL